MDAHKINDIVLTVINDGDGSLCGYNYDQRLQAARTNTIGIFKSAAQTYMNTSAENIDLAAEELMEYYKEHLKEF
jgi:hypothetical protein